MDNRRNAIGYGRVSSREQAEGFSLENQRETCYHRAEADGYSVVKWFANTEGESAKTANRPALKELIEFVSKSKHKVEALYVWKFDRLARNLGDYTDLLAFFHRLGIEVISVTEPADNSSAGKLMKNIYGSFAQYENDVKSERTVAGMKQAVKGGRWVWRPPLGYRMAKDSSGRKLLEVDEKAKYIRLAFRMAAKGIYTQVDICKRLRRRGFAIYEQRLNCILRNPVYTGLIVKPEWFAEPIEGLHEPLVDRRTFHRIQDALNRKKPPSRARKRDNPDFPLRNFLRCPVCSVPITGSWSTGRNGTRHPYYHCRKAGCGLGNVRRDVLHEEFISVLQDVQPNGSVLSLFRVILKDAWRSRHELGLKEGRRIKCEITKLEAEMKGAAIQLLRGVLSEELFTKVTDDHTKQIDSLRASLGDVDADLGDISECIQYCSDFLSKIAEVWSSASLSLRQRFQSFIFPRGITYFGGSFGTAETSIIFNVLGGKNAEKSNLVTPTGVEPVFAP